MVRSRTQSYSVVVMLFLVGCVLLSFWDGQPAKASPAGQASSFNVEGRINTLGQNKLTLNSEENMIFHVTYDDKTEFKSDDGSPSSSKDLRVGLRIRVAGDFTESGEIAAQRIEVVKAPPKN